MELGTFGAIFKFAIEFEQASEKFYDEAASSHDPFAEWAAGAKRRAARLDRVRREMVTEMILEPISGKRATDYQVDWTLHSQASCFAQARAIEETGRGFYAAMADCVSVEVARVFKRLADEHARNLAILTALDPETPVRGAG